jgi:hypothetical protein
MSRYKRTLGDHLHARKLSGQQAEAAIGVAVLNRMMDAGCPDSIRIVCNPRGRMGPLRLVRSRCTNAPSRCSSLCLGLVCRRGQTRK